MSPRCRFVQPDIVRLPLSDGDFVDIKRELNAGEQRRVFSSLVQPGVGFGEKVTLDPHLVGKTKLVAYLLGWSFVDAAGAPVPFSEAAIDNLDSETYREIVAAVDEHEAKVGAEREAKKKIPAGEPASSLT